MKERWRPQPRMSVLQDLCFFVRRDGFCRLDHRGTALCRPRLGLVAFLIAVCCSAEIIDRIAISVGNQVITVAQIEEEMRITAFLNLEKLDLSVEAKKKAADRLMEQALVKRDMEFSPYPQTAQSAVDDELARVKARFADAAAYQKTLQQYGTGEDSLKSRLAWQLTLVDFTNYRFRPAVHIAEADLKQHYQQQVAELQQRGVQQIPPFEDVRDKIEEILTNLRIEEAIDRWIADTRKQVPIRYHEAAP